MKTILVIREFDDFSRILATGGFEVFNLPLIETKVSNDLSDFEAKLLKLESYAGIFVTSRHAAQILADHFFDKNVNFSGKVYVLGKRSFEILEYSNLDLFYEPTANTAREMLENIPLEDLKGKKFLFVRGEKSLRIVPDFLSKISTIEETIVYETRGIAVNSDHLNVLRERFARKEITATCFFSPSAAESFLEQFGAEIAHQTVIATIGKTTAEYFERRTVTVGVVSSASNAETFAQELKIYLKGI